MSNIVLNFQEFLNEGYDSNNPMDLDIHGYARNRKTIAGLKDSGAEVNKQSDLGTPKHHTLIELVKDHLDAMILAADSMDYETAVEELEEARSFLKYMDRALERAQMQKSDEEEAENPEVDEDLRPEEDDLIARRDLRAQGILAKLDRKDRDTLGAVEKYVSWIEEDGNLLQTHINTNNFKSARFYVEELEFLLRSVKPAILKAAATQQEEEDAQKSTP